MRAVVQRVTKASVTVGGEQVSSIGRGLCVLLGISAEDTQKDAEYMVRKVLNLRLFEDESGRAWSKSVMERDFEVLCVSQFTLQCVLKGNKPDFHLAMPAELAQPFYGSILENMRSAYKPEMIKAIEAGEAAAEEGEDPLQRTLGVRTGQGGPALQTGPQCQQRGRGGRVLRAGALTVDGEEAEGPDPVLIRSSSRSGSLQ
ncbi:D-aminoacyl-tRNA deacylase 1 isoform X2 [Kryptolebias marmoratus]|uniref:D-aminoacyl-tRNA deacylase 1 isoform X2 n=1 Tax=Kryptolebias marmoratus TaxID=37003 RepID=UPI0018ACA3C3|nr:D-aminoacyl-tRNA deacylase 1 isoform X2 [Kryptolebias marmoratus]